MYTLTLAAMTIAAGSSTHGFPSISSQSLSSGVVASTSVDTALRQHGGVVISDVPGLAVSNHAALQALAECGQTGFGGFYRKTLQDGSDRWTLAGFAQEPMALKEVRSRCGELDEALAPLRDIVGELGGHVVKAMAPTFDHLGPAAHHGGMAPLLAMGKQLEHFHLYSSQGGQSSYPAVPFHKDSGAFILLTKSLVFQGNETLPEPERTGLMIVDQNSEHSLKLQDDEALLLAGEALHQFLGAQVSVPSHGVRLNGLPTRSLRAWHGRMFLFPEESVNGKNETAKQLFLAPLEKVSPNTTGWLQGLKDDCESGTTGICWMQEPVCLDMCSDGMLQRCLLPSFEKGDCSATAMDPSCAYRCLSDKPIGFCDPKASTDMYMKGFTSMYKPNRACIVLFFQGAKLDTLWKFVVAMVVVLLMGVTTQGIIALRPIVSRKTNNNFVVEALMFGLNVALGWFMMLVAMTFSTELFICATAGLILGHMIFNRSADSTEILGSPCCNAVNGANVRRKVADESAGPLLQGQVLHVLNIEGMTCGSCTATVASAIRGVPCVADVVVLLAQKRAEVRCQQDVNVQDLVDAVEAVGFDATVQPSARN